MTLPITAIVPGAAAAAVAPTALKQALLIGRGGAATFAATSLAPQIVANIVPRGGAAVASPQEVLANFQPPWAKKKEVVEESTSILNLPPVARSVLCAATGMALHYLGYSFARSITIALFTSKSTGYPDTPGAFPFAMAFVSPCSLLLLFRYGKMLEAFGPRGALQRSTLLCAIILLFSGIAIEVSEQTQATFFGGIYAMKFLTGPLFVFRESYVQLLTSQYWSFMASVLTPDQSTKWFAPIAGLTSISSAVGGMAVSKLTSKINLGGTLALAGLSLVCSTFFADAAYGIAVTNGFDPSEKTAKAKKSTSGGDGSGHGGEDSLITKARKLFKRVPVLRALFIEILASQGLSTLLNVCFVQSLGSSIQDDTERAGWIGNFYATINIISMILQFTGLPLLMQVIEPKVLWRIIPIISFGFTTFQALQESPTLYIVAGSLLVMKVLEYSARRMLDEMVYVPLDFESRFIGKEIISVFGFRFGKSLMSLVLSALTSACGHFSLQQLSMMSDVAALLWAKVAWDLSGLVPTRKEAQAKYNESHKGAGKKGK